MNWELSLFVSRIVLAAIAALLLEVTPKELLQFRKVHAVFVWWLALPVFWSTVIIVTGWLLFRKKLIIWWNNLE